MSNINVKKKQLYLNDRAKYCVSGMKENGNIAYFLKNDIFHESCFSRLWNPAGSFW